MYKKLNYFHVRLLCFLFFVNIFINNIHSQSQFASLRGFVTDSTSGESIAFANLIIVGTKLGASSNTRGYYFIPAIKEGLTTVKISYMGYETREITFNAIKGQISQIDIRLVPRSIELQELSIIAQKPVRENEPNLGMQKISIKEINMHPAGLEADIFRVIQSTAGVNSTGDVTSKYYVRGGNSDQNAVLLNGATIYNPFHALGIFSVIDPEIISVMEFFKGGFSPKYGSRLSSILNVVTRDGNKNSYHASAQSSLISGKISAEGPIPNGSFLVTGRKSYYPKILKKYLNDKEVPFDFYDLSFKANYNSTLLDNNSKFVAFGFLSNDKVDNNDPYLEDYKIKNTVLGVNWHKVWSSPLFSVITVNYSRFDAELTPNLSESKPRKNILTDFSTDFNFTYVYDSKDELEFGVQNKAVTTELNMENLNGFAIKSKQSGYDLSMYFNYRFYRWENLGLDLGLRSKLVGITKKRPFLFEPRISTTYIITNGLSIKGVIGRYSQELTTLADESELISVFEPWVIIPDYLAAPEATHFILGVEIKPTEEIIIELEGYYKDLINLAEVNQKKTNPSQNDYINVDGEAYGLESNFSFQNNSIFFKTSYSLSWAYKIKNNVKYFPRYDSRNNLSVLLSVDLGKGWLANANWAFKSGMPYTPISGFYDRLIVDPWGNYSSIGFLPSIYWGDKNSQRLPVYHRLDLSVTKKFDLGFANISIGASVINVYNRNNIYYFDTKTGKRVNMIPVLPSVFAKVDL
ncbi:MAG: TonB-dependent receptor [bacterium]